MKTVFLTIEGAYVQLSQIVVVTTQSDYTVVTTTNGRLYTKDPIDTVKAAIDAAVAQANA